LISTPGTTTFGRSDAPRQIAGGFIGRPRNGENVTRNDRQNISEMFAAIL
jgi:hypothetical protein